MTIQNKRILFWVRAGAAVLGLALAWELFRYFCFPAYLIFPLALGLGYTAARTFETGQMDGKGRLFPCCAVFALLLAASAVIGGKVDIDHKRLTYFNADDLPFFAALALAAFFVSAWLAGIVFRHPLNRAQERGASPKKVWAVCSAVLLASWLPCLLIYYPGSVSPDSLACIVRAIGRAGLSNQQPVFYILLMEPFLRFGLAIGKSLNFGTALFLLFQAAAMAVMLGYLPGWLVKQGCPLWTAVLAMAYFTLNPVFPMYAVTMWKDVLFGGLIMLYALNLFDTVRSGGETLKTAGGMAWFLALNVLIAFMRNNGYYIIFVTLIVLAIVYRREWKRFAPAFLAVLTAVPIIQGPVYDACGVAQSPFAESVGIPLQQIGYTVTHDGTVTPEQRDFLDQLMPLDEMKTAYTPLSSNGIKFHKDFNNAFLEKHKTEFLKVWAGMLAPNLKNYLKAYFLETVGFWHVGTSNWVLYYGIGPGYGAQKAGLSQTNLTKLLDTARLEKNRTRIAAAFNSLQIHIPILRGLVNIGFLFWATVFAAFLMLIRRKGKYLLAFLPLLILWGTLMAATPTFCEFRYMFSFAVCLPASLFLPFFPEKSLSGKKETSSALS